MERISSAEWEIMRVIWSNQPVYTKEIINILKDQQDWSASTIKTLLARLVQKEVVGVNKTTSKFQYVALIDKTQYVESEMQHLLSKVCNKTKMHVLTDIVESCEMSDADFELLQNILKNKKISQNVDCYCPKGMCDNEKI